MDRKGGRSPGMRNVSAVRFLLPTAVAGAALLGSACVATASVSAGTQPRPRQPFAIVLDHSYGGRPATVINVATRGVAGRIRTPVARSSFEWAAATGGRTFVLGGETQSLAWRFYKVTL